MAPDAQTNGAPMPAWLASALTHYGYLAVFVGVFLENLGVPVPGETVLLAASFFSREHLLRIWIVVPCAIIAAICGDNFGYWIGRHAGKRVVERYGRFVGLTPARLERVESSFRRHGPRTIFFARFVSGLRVVAAIFAGVSAIRWPVFVVFNAAGAIVWASAVGALGWAFGQSWPLLERWVGRTGLIVLTAVVVAAVFAIAHSRRLRTAATSARNELEEGHEKR